MIINISMVFVVFVIVVKCVGFIGMGCLGLCIVFKFE